MLRRLPRPSLARARTLAATAVVVAVVGVAAAPAGGTDAATGIDVATARSWIERTLTGDDDAQRADVAGVIEAGRRLRRLPEGLAPPDPRRRVAVFGDSLAEEAEPYTQWLATAGGTTHLRQWTLGGTAPCDWAGRFESVLAGWQPEVVVVAFSGNALTPCMADAREGAAYAERYLADARWWATTAAEAGATVLFVSPPAMRSAPGMGHPVQQAYAEVSAAMPATAEWVYGGTDVSPGDVYRDTLPGPDGEEQVRNPDGIHFCPTPTRPPGAPCPVDSPGARRYATTIAEALALLAG